jgi:AmiR/NasT family two-component response regulator
MAASNEQIELLQIQNDEGPCLDCYRAGQAVIVNDLRVESAWPTSQASRSRKTARLSALREMHLQHALDSRVVIEQAKGMLAAHASLPMEEAFARLRSYARRNNLGLTQVAHDLVGGRRSVDEIAGARPR